MTLTEGRQRVRAILKEWDVLTEVLTTPIVYHPGGWEDTVPEELKREVLRQRAKKMADGGWEEATDAEVLCYLMTASLVQPLSSDWTQIFLYQGAQFMPQVREAVPDTPKELSDYQKSELSDLKRKIRDSQIRRRKSNRKEKGMYTRKLVLEEHEKSVLVGIQKPDTDPFVRTVVGTLDEALAYIPKFLAEANEEWAVSPKKPAYVPPKTAKPATTPAAAATPEPQKAEALPLLATTEPGKPAEAPAEEQAPVPTEARAEVQAEVPPEAPVEEKAPEVEAKVTESQAEPAEIEPEPVEQAAAPSGPAKPGEYEYYLQDGRGPFESVQAAMDEMGLDQATRPQHNRWDRLSTALKEKIQRRPKA